MATNTLIQKLYAADEIDSSKSTYNADSLLASQSNRRQIETFMAAAAVVANEIVMVTPSLSTGANQVMRVTKCGADANGNPRAVGVALHAAAAGEPVKVVISGYATVKASGAVAAGDRLLATQAGGDGSVVAEAVYDFATPEANTLSHLVFGVALDAKDAVTNLVNIWVYNRF